MDCLIDGELPPLIKPGEYEMVLVEFRTQMFFGRAPKLVMLFKVVQLGEAFETVLPRYYNLQKVIGKLGKNGSFKVGKRSDFLRELCTVFPSVNVRRLDRIPMSCFDGVIIKARVDTVTHDSKQCLIPKPLQYSKVSKLVGVVN